MATRRISSLLKYRFTFWYYLIKILPFEWVYNLLKDKPVLTYKVGDKMLSVSFSQARA